MSLLHLIYTSTATQNFSATTLLEILTKARQNNSQLNISGMLLHSGGNFFQVLEGNPETVKEIYEKIKLDSRHKNVCQIINEPIAQRNFSEWTMGFIDIDPEKLKDIVGLNDFYTSGTCIDNLDPGRAKKILTAFSKGYWHQSIK